MANPSELPEFALPPIPQLDDLAGLIESCNTSYVAFKTATEINENIRHSNELVGKQLLLEAALLKRYQLLRSPRSNFESCMKGECGSEIFVDLGMNELVCNSLFLARYEPQYRMLATERDREFTFNYVGLTAITMFLRHSGIQNNTDIFRGICMFGFRKSEPTSQGIQSVDLICVPLTDTKILKISGTAQ